MTGEPCIVCRTSVTVPGTGQVRHRRVGPARGGVESGHLWTSCRSFVTVPGTGQGRKGPAG